jgi:hypothetical protein
MVTLKKEKEKFGKGELPYENITISDYLISLHPLVPACGM